jgi:hypothetical protein
MACGLHRYYGAHHLHFITLSCHRRLPLLRSSGGRWCDLSATHPFDFAQGRLWGTRDLDLGHLAVARSENSLTPPLF